MISRHEANCAAWTNARVERLRQLWHDGLTANMIAEELGGGLTRNAVLGKIHRMGIRRDESLDKASWRRPSRARTGRCVPESTPRPPKIVEKRLSPHVGRVNIAGVLSGSGGLPAQAVIEIPPVSSNGGVTLLELRATTCRWPQGDPSEKSFRFCGAHCPIDQPYCAFHATIAYPPAQDRRARQAARAAR